MGAPKLPNPNMDMKAAAQPQASQEPIAEEAACRNGAVVIMVESLYVLSILFFVQCVRSERCSPKFETRTSLLTAAVMMLKSNKNNNNGNSAEGKKRG